MNPQSLSLNPSSLKTRFTKRFLQALTKINKNTPTSSSPREAFQKYYRIKTAAEKSLACAVGSRRAWARAILCRIKHKRRKRSENFVRRIKHRKIALKRKGIGLKVEETNGVIGQVDKLRKVVPGCEGMDFCRLLEETADYIKCLNTQVQAMRCVAHFYSGT